MAKRVVVADDHALVREGVSSMLRQAGYRVVGEAADAEELLGLVRGHVPDLVVVDIRMPPTQNLEGLHAARAIRADFPEIGILLLTAHVEIETAVDLLEGGDRIGYLLKNRVMNANVLVDALERIAAGGAVLDPALVQELISARRRFDPLESLTPREREVIALMAEGRTNAGIAHRLWITEGAVEKHVRHILAKLRLPATTEDHRRVLAVLAYLDAA